LDEALPVTGIESGQAESAQTTVVTRRIQPIPVARASVSGGAGLDENQSAKDRPAPIDPPAPAARAGS
jgi:hypothetical protein